MKKILLLTLSILMVTAAFAKFAKAGNPIPSYNVPVSSKAYFQEANSVLVNYSPSDEKRDMNISNDTPGNRPIGSGMIQAYIYRLDQSIILGPFNVYLGETLTIPIDEYRWGVYIETKDDTFVSVWTSSTQL
jgi:hypothetical protein